MPTPATTKNKASTFVGALFFVVECILVLRLLVSMSPSFAFLLTGGFIQVYKRKGNAIAVGVAFADLQINPKVD